MERKIKIFRILSVLIVITGAYRTASFNSLCVTADKIPKDIVQKNGAMAKKKLEAKIGKAIISASENDVSRRMMEETMNI
jgi:hypothetical protein